VPGPNNCHISTILPLAILKRSKPTTVVGLSLATGPNIDIAIKLIKRLKGIFERKLGLVFQNKETVLELNGCTIEAFPSNHLDAYRALDNPKFIFLDEADMFRK
jgi:hypothetical protein